VAHVRHARERDAAVVDAADREVLHEAVAWQKSTTNIKGNCRNKVPRIKESRNK